MRDTWTLRRRFEQALLCVPLSAFALSCEGSAEHDPTPSLTEGKPAEDTPPIETPDVGTAQTKSGRSADSADRAASGPESGSSSNRPPPPVKVGTGRGNPFGNVPTCPTESWCATKAQARKHKVPKTSKSGGCPNEVYVPDEVRFGNAQVSSTKRTARLTKDPKHALASPDADCCYEWARPCAGGRALLDDGHQVLPQSHHRAPPTPDSALANALGLAWLEDARVEYASVASFSRTVLELMAVGAPADLVAQHHAAALDEVRHAHACLAIAQRYLHSSPRLGAVPALAPRPGGLAAIAVNAFLEGCLGETVGTLLAQRAARGCTDPSIRRTLETIAEDEAKHAELAWRVVAWALQSGGTEVVDALHDAIERSVPPASAPTAPPSDEHARRRHGRLPDTAVEACAREAWFEIVEPVANDLVARTRGRSTSLDAQMG